MAPRPMSRAEPHLRGREAAAHLHRPGTARREDAALRQRDEVGDVAGNRRQRAAPSRNPGRIALQQLHRVGMSGAVEDVAHRAALHHFATVHHDHIVAELGDHPEMVGDEQDCAALAPLQFLQPVNDLHLQGRVERGGRLVRDQQRGLGLERHRDRDPLPHPARELVGVVPHAPLRIRNPDPPQHLHRARGLLLPAPHPPVLDVHHLGADGEHRVERGHRILEHHRYPLAADCAHCRGRRLQQVLPFEAHFPRRDARVLREQAHHRARERRLSRAALTDHAHHRSGGDVEVDVPQRLERAPRGGELHVQAAHLQHGALPARGAGTAHTSFRSFGSNTSRRLSPRKVKPRVVMMTGSPPAMAGQGVLYRKE